MNDTAEHRLRELLAERAATVTPGTVPLGAIRAAVRHDRRRSLRRLSLRFAAGLAAVASAATVLPGSVAWPPDRDHATAGTMLAWPARGDLVGDRAWIRQAQRKLYSRWAPQPRLLFAGRVESGRLAVLGAPAERKHPTTIRLNIVYARDHPSGQVHKGVTTFEMDAREQAIAWWDQDQHSTGAPYLVLLTPDKHTGATLSEGPAFADDGRVTRRWRPLPTPNGFAVGRFAAGSLVEPRARVDGRAVHWQPPGDIVDYAEGRPTAAETRFATDLAERWPVQPAGPTPTPRDVLHLLARVQRAFRMPVADLDVRPVWSGWAEDERGRLPTIQLAAVVTLPTGPVLQVVGHRHTDGDFWWTDRIRSIRRADPLTVPFAWVAARTQWPDPPPATARVQVVAPAGAATVTVGTGGPTVRSAPPGPGRDVMLAAPTRVRDWSTVTVAALGADRRVIGTTQPWDQCGITKLVHGPC